MHMQGHNISITSESQKAMEHYQLECDKESQNLAYKVDSQIGIDVLQSRHEQVLYKLWYYTEPFETSCLQYLNSVVSSKNIQIKSLQPRWAKWFQYLEKLQGFAMKQQMITLEPAGRLKVQVQDIQKEKCSFFLWVVPSLWCTTLTWYWSVLVN